MPCFTNKTQICTHCRDETHIQLLIHGAKAHGSHKLLQKRTPHFHTRPMHLHYTCTLHITVKNVHAFVYVCIFSMCIQNVLLLKTDKRFCQFFCLDFQVVIKLYVLKEEAGTKAVFISTTPWMNNDNDCRKH